MQGFTADGWLMDQPGVRAVPSPHFDPWPARPVIDLVVVHNISLPKGVYGGPQIEALFCGTLDCTAHPTFTDLAGLRVSAHFLIRRSAEIVQFVSTHHRAWHAGVSSFQGRTGCNDFSIGIELEGSDDDDFEAVQVDRLVNLLRVLIHELPSLRWVVGHSDIAPGRKSDPGPFFNWRDFLAKTHAAGLVFENPFRV
jgi:N-acetyl-anhydromuramoyl-L-alanine amidase